MLSFQMIWFRENWYEELLRQLNEGLSLCQAAAFESRADGMYSTYVVEVSYCTHVSAPHENFGERNYKINVNFLPLIITKVLVFSLHGPKLL